MPIISKLKYAHQWNVENQDQNYLAGLKKIIFFYKQYSTSMTKLKPTVLK